jgi:hypothetical protein
MYKLELPHNRHRITKHDLNKGNRQYVGSVRRFAWRYVYVQVDTVPWDKLAAGMGTVNRVHGRACFMCNNCFAPRSEANRGGPNKTELPHNFHI